MTGWIGIERPGGPAPERPRSRFARGFDPDSLATREELQAAVEELKAEIAHIEAQIEAAAMCPDVLEERGPGWLVAAKSALAFRERTRKVIGHRLYEMNKAAERAAAEERAAQKAQARQEQAALAAQHVAAKAKRREDHLRRLEQEQASKARKHEAWLAAQAVRAAKQQMKARRLGLLARLLWQRHPEIADALWAEVQAELPIEQEGREEAA